MVKKKIELFSKPTPTLSSAQKRELVRRIAIETEIKPIEPTIELPKEVPVEEIFREPIREAPPLRIRSSILKQENGSILTRNKNLFFKG